MTYPVMKEFHRLVRRIDRLTDGQACMGEINWDNGSLDEFVVFIMPKAGYYRGGKFKFTINVPDTYPCAVAPVVWCHTPIYHPNIDPTDAREDGDVSNVCLNILSSDWDPAIGLEGVVLGLIFLLYNPNEDDALSPVFDSSDSKEEFAEKVRRSLDGDEVDGFRYEANTCNEKEVEENVDVTNTDAKACEGDEQGGSVGVTADMNDNKREGNDEAVDDTNVSKNEGQDGSVDVTANTNDAELVDRVDVNTTCAGETTGPTANESEDQGTNNRVRGEDEVFREMMANECDLDEIGEFDVGLVMVDGEYGLVIGTDDSAVQVLNDNEGQNVCVIENSNGESTEECTLMNEEVQTNDAGVGETSVLADASASNSKEMQECLAVTDQEGSTSTESCADENIVISNVVENEPNKPVGECNEQNIVRELEVDNGLLDRTLKEKSNEALINVTCDTDISDHLAWREDEEIANKIEEPRQVPQNNGKLRKVRDVITAAFLGVWHRHRRNWDCRYKYE